MSTILGSTKLGKFSLGNGFSNGNGNFTVRFPQLDIAKPLWVSDFNIEPPRVRIDPSMKEIIEKVSASLAKKSLKYNSKQHKDWTLKEIMLTKDNKEEKSKSRIIRDGYSAIVAETSATINRSSIDHTTKFLLSNEPLYVYALSYVIYYEKVKDAEGINDRVLALVESEVRSFFNVLLAKAAIEQRHLDLTPEQKKNIYKAASETTISYLEGLPSKAISKIISKYVDHGNLHRLVDKFFESGEIDPAKGTPQIRQLMVDYLKEIGLIVSDVDILTDEADDVLASLEELPELEDIDSTEDV